MAGESWISDLGAVIRERFWKDFGRTSEDVGRIWQDLWKVLDLAAFGKDFGRILDMGFRCNLECGVLE